MKRIYAQVAVVEHEDGFSIRLDAQQLLTPAKQPLNLPTAALARAVAVEWEAQAAEVRPATMPLMRLASTAIDRVAARLDAVIEQTANYAGTDLLCYRADDPPALIELQGRIWQPLLDWAALRFDAPLHVTAGIVPIDQPADSLRALRATLGGFDVLTLTGVADLTAALGSLILALAVWDRRFDADSAFAASRLDEAFQNERWGEDYEAADRREALHADVTATARFLDLLRG